MRLMMADYWGFARWATAEPLKWAIVQGIAIDQLVDAAKQADDNGYPFDGMCLYALMFAAIVVAMVAHLKYRPRSDSFVSVTPLE